eukprot:7605140-Pyramimonas_sp.AAC.1
MVRQRARFLRRNLQVGLVEQRLEPEDRISNLPHGPHQAARPPHDDVVDRNRRPHSWMRLAWPIQRGQEHYLEHQRGEP